MSGRYPQSPAITCSYLWVPTGRHQASPAITYRYNMCWCRAPHIVNGGQDICQDTYRARASLPGLIAVLADVPSTITESHSSTVQSACYVGGR